MLKVGCPVMLVRNMSNRLVNGLQGIVKSLTKSSVRVFFQQLNQVVELKKETFTSHNALLGKDTASRKQIPLKLSFAMTIHKSQGMSLDFVEVVCSGVFAPGQLAVAVGRAKSTEGLAVFNFDPTIHIIPQSEELISFIDSPSCSTNVDKSCCQQVRKFQEIPASEDVEFTVPDEDEEDNDCKSVTDEDVLQDLVELAAFADEAKSSEEDLSSDSTNESTDDFDSASESTDDFDCDVNNLDLANADPEKVPFNIDAVSEISKQLYSDAETPEQLDVNKSVQEVLKKDGLQNIANTLLILIDELWNQHVEKVKKVKSPILTAFYSNWHSIVTGKLYCKLPMFNTAGQKECLSKLCASLREEYVSWVSKKSEQAATSSAQTSRMSKAGEGKVRYLVGRAIVMVRKRCMNTVRNTICKQHYRKKYRIACSKLHHLDHMRTSIRAICRGKYGHTIQETERRQNVGGGLTHIKDSVFECFLHLEILRGKLHTVARAKALKGAVLADSLKCVKEDEDLQQLFSKVFDSMEPSEQNIVDLLFNEVVDSYMVVANNEFRKAVANELGKRKKLRHRVAVLCPSQLDPSKGGKITTSQNESEKGRGKRSAKTVHGGEPSCIAAPPPKRGKEESQFEHEKVGDVSDERATTPTTPGPTGMARNGRGRVRGNGQQGTEESEAGQNQAGKSKNQQGNTAETMTTRCGRTIKRPSHLKD